MKIEFISNTGAYLEHDGRVLGMDVWLTQGPFEGSWFHYPPLRKTRHDVSDCDCFYISHIHPDHCDLNALSTAKPSARFVVPSYMDRLLERKLHAYGFRDVVSLSPGESAAIGPGIEVTLFGQFKNNLFADAAFGSLIDSALLVRWDGRTVLNCNDNYLDEPSARKIAASGMDIDLALMPHSASGPYPASFRNLTIDDKRAEAARLQRDYIAHFCAMAAIVNARFTVPCAAEYVVVGHLYEKNPFIGLASADEAAAALDELARTNGLRTKAVRLDCGTILDIDTGTLSGLEPRHFSEADRSAFAAQLKDVPFAYQWDSACTDSREFDRLVRRAREHIWQKQSALRWTRDYNVYLNAGPDLTFHFNFRDDAPPRRIEPDAKRLSPYLECFLSRQLLYSILVGKAHWNNAEGGLHIDFHREPNTYMPEVFTLMSFLHEPTANLAHV